MAGGTRGFDPVRLRELREARGLTQEAVAERVGVRRTYLIQWERSADRPTSTAPSPSMLVKLARVLDVDPSELTTISREAALLSDLRTWAGLSQPELARRLDVPNPSLSAVERGKRPLRDDLADAIARVLGVSVTEIRAAYERARDR